MSYESEQDFGNLIVSLEDVAKGYKPQFEDYKPTFISGGEGEFNVSFIGQFANDLDTYYDSVASTGDQLPWGVKAVWQGQDFTKEMSLPNGLKFGEGESLITDSSWAVGAGVSKYLLDDVSNKATAAVNKFAIVIDSGVAKLDDFTIGSISNALSYSFVDSDYDGNLAEEDPFKDDNGHGTHVAGTIAAKADGKGVVGVAPGAEVISMKVFGASGSTTINTIMDAVTQAVSYVKNDSVTIDNKVLDTSALTFENTVINMSLGGGYYQPLISLVDNAAADGVKFAIAAGNSNKDVDSVSPAASGQAENVYTISAVDKKYKMASFTNWDDDSAGNSSQDDVDFAGPGVNVLSYKNANGDLDWWSGTSMATPAVAGLMLMTDYDAVGKKLKSNPNDSSGNITGVQAGEMAFGNDSMPGPYVDPFALTTIKPYTDSNPDPKDPDEGDDNDKNDSSPWDGYDPGTLYYNTYGLAAGINGTYNLSTGSGAVDQATLEKGLSIDSGKLDLSMQSVDGSLTKNAINATEGSGVKLTGYANEGDTVSFSYTIASNDYIPYNDFAFVQLKTGDGLGANSKSTLNTLGAIGLDVDNFGSKTGTFSYTFTKEDFFESNNNYQGVPQTDSNGAPIYQGYYDLSVGVTDAIDTWVSTSLLVQALGITKKGDKPSSGDGGTYTDGVLTWATNSTLGNNNTQGTEESGNVVTTMSTGSGAVGQSILEALIGLDAGSLDTNLNGTKTAINASEGSATFATTKAKKDDIVSFEATFDTSDYSPYNDFSFYSINGKAYKIVALGEGDVADFGKITKTINYTLKESDFDSSTYDENNGGGNLTIGFGVMDALDWAVDTSLKVEKVKVYTPGTAEEPASDSPGANDIAEGFSSFDIYYAGNLVTDGTKNSSNGTLKNDSSLTSIELSTQYSYNSAGGGLSNQSSIEFLAGLKSGTLDTSLNGTKTSKNATSGSVVTVKGAAAVGDKISFDFDFTSQDYSPFEDFAFVSLNNEAYTLIDNAVGSDNVAATNKYAKVSGSAGSSNLKGSYSYTFTKDDLGGTFGNIDLSVGILNALDNAVTSKVTLTNLKYTPSGVTDESGQLNTGFADEYVADYTYVGDVWIEKDVYSGFSLSTGGCVSNAVSQSNIESFGGFSSGTLDQSLNVYGSTDVKTAINATEGSAVKFNSKAAAGDIVSFYYSFSTNDYLPYADFSWFNIGSTTEMIAGIGNSSNGGNVANFGSKEGLVSYTIKDSDLNSDGTFDLTVGIVDAKDGWVESVIDIWGFNVTEIDEGETAPVYDKDNPNEDQLDAPSEETKEDDYAKIDIEMLGNTFQQNNTMVMSTGGGAVEQNVIESALGIKYGELDGTLNGTKVSDNATEGSAAYDSVQVSAGQVISFGYTFFTDDYAPYKDYAFFSINGIVSAIEVVGDTVNDQGSVTDVFNYAVQSSDLGGETSGIVQIGVGIVDVKDSYVDSTIEVYDFEISGETKEGDKSGDGIVDGAGAYAISTNISSGGYSANNTNKIKISYNGETVTSSTSNEWDIEAANIGGDGVYAVLLKGQGAKDGLWGYTLANSYGELFTTGSGSLNNVDWVSTSQASTSGWEEWFGIDLDGDSLISQLNDGNQALSLYSESTGVINIKDNGSAVGTSSILAATPTKADFGLFTTSAETFKILVAGTNENSGKFQVWTSTNDGTIINKQGYVDYSTSTPTTYDWYTAMQGVSDGLEDIFKVDLDNDGLLSGGANYQLYSPNGKLQLKNLKGTTLSQSNTPYYDVIAAELQSDNNLKILLKGSGSTYNSLYSVWDTDQYGKVTSEGQWFSNSELMSNDWETYFNVDANGDGYLGSAIDIVEDLTSGVKLTKNAQGNAFATPSGSTTPIKLTINGNPIGMQVGNYNLVDAESYKGTNYLVFNSVIEQKISVWTMDSSWSFQSAQNAAYGTNDYNLVEGLIGSDFDNNGVIADITQDSEGNDVVNYGTSKLVESEGNLSVTYNLYEYVIVAGIGENSGTALKFKNGDYLTATKDGAQLMGAEKIATVSSNGGFELTNSVVYKDSDNNLDVYQFNQDGSYKTDYSISQKTDFYWSVESQYNSDFDTDGIIGIGSKYLETNGNNYIAYDNYGGTSVKESIDGKISYTSIKKDGVNISYKNNGLSMLEIDTLSNGDKYVIWKNDSNNQIVTWSMDNNWNYTQSNTYNADDDAPFFLEAVFKSDFNGDSIIGKDKDGDGSFDWDDLTNQGLESKGSVMLMKDINNQLYADHQGNSIKYNGKELKNSDLAQHGWDFLGVDTGYNQSSNQMENYGVIQNKNDSNQYALVNFGVDWNHDSSSEIWQPFNTNNIDALYKFAEETMVQDFNKNTSIGL